MPPFTDQCLDAADMAIAHLEDENHKLKIRCKTLEAALAPFAARVHFDGIEAPYPEEEWGPMLQFAKDALEGD